MMAAPRTLTQRQRKVVDYFRGRGPVDWTDLPHGPALRGLVDSGTIVSYAVRRNGRVRTYLYALAEAPPPTVDGFTVTPA